jgi:predicted nucleic acid-binding protein
MTRIYVETSVWSHWFAEDAPEARKATRIFLERCRELAGEVQLLVGELVIIEVSRAPGGKNLELGALIREFNPVVLAETAAVGELARAYVAHGAMPPSKPADAMHAAFATVHGADILTSWNYRHLVNWARRRKLLAVNALMEYTRQLEIVTPPEVFYDACQQGTADGLGRPGPDQPGDR